MAGTLFENNLSPYLTLVEGSAPASPSAGDHRLYVDSADHLLKWKDSSGAVRLATGQPLGLTGATAATRYVGGTASGAPGSGTFAVGDFVIDQTAKVYVCTVAGSPGTWVQAGGGGASGGVLGGVTYTTTGSPWHTTGPNSSLTAIDTTNARITFTAPASGIVVVAISCYLVWTGNLGSAFLGVLEGASQLALQQMCIANAANDQMFLNAVWVITGLSAGSHTFDAAFKASGTSAVFNLNTSTNQPFSFAVIS